MTMKLIQTRTLVAPAQTISLTSIPQTFTDLLILTGVRGTLAGTSQINFQFNGSSVAAYSDKFLQGTGSALSSGARATQPVIRITAVTSSGFTANTFSNVSVYIPNYTSDRNKVVSLDGVIENNATEGYQEIVAGLWSNTEAISSISMTIQGGSNFAIGSTVSLYGILKNSDGTVTAS
jgi:hypothetical protein